MKYKIVSENDKLLSTSIRKVEKQVNELIKQGWKPIGGISVSQADRVYNIYGAYQAMIIED